MLGVPSFTSEFPGIDSIGQQCRIASSVTVFRDYNKIPNHGIILGDNVSLYDHVRLVLGDPAQHPDTNLVLGNNIIVNTFCYLSGEGGLTISDEVLIGPYVRILSAGHVIDDGQLSVWRNPLNYGRITIDTGAWVAAGVTILQGVSIGSGAVIGAASVVSCDIPSAAIAVGSPARVLRYRKGFEPAKTFLPRRWLGRFRS